MKFVLYGARIVRNIRITNSHMANVDPVELSTVIIALVEFIMVITIYALRVKKITEGNSGELTEVRNPNDIVL